MLGNGWCWALLTRVPLVMLALVRVRLRGTVATNTTHTDATVGSRMALPVCMSKVRLQFVSK
jgi:hypothetical protein